MKGPAIAFHLSKSAINLLMDGFERESKKFFDELVLISTMILLIFSVFTDS
jgi:hypothetical protein